MVTLAALSFDGFKRFIRGVAGSCDIGIQVMVGIEIVVIVYFDKFSIGFALSLIHI